MNPVIFFDELDKVSETPRGEEIIGVLTHLTDHSQNKTFADRRSIAPSTSTVDARARQIRSLRGFDSSRFMMLNKINPRNIHKEIPQTSRLRDS